MPASTPRVVGEVEWGKSGLAPAPTRALLGHKARVLSFESQSALVSRVLVGAGHPLPPTSSVHNERAPCSGFLVSASGELQALANWARTHTLCGLVHIARPLRASVSSGSLPPRVPMQAVQCPESEEKVDVPRLQSMAMGYPWVFSQGLKFHPEERTVFAEGQPITAGVRRPGRGEALLPSDINISNTDIDKPPQRLC